MITKVGTLTVKQMLESIEWAISEAESNIGLHTGGPKEFEFRGEVALAKTSLEYLRNSISKEILKTLS